MKLSTKLLLGGGGLVVALLALVWCLFPESHTAIAMIGAPLSLATVAPLGLSSLFGGHRDPFLPQNERQARVRVVVAPQNGMSCLGHRLTQGEHEILVYARDIDHDGPRGGSLRSRVRSAQDRVLWDVAIESDKRQFEMWQKENPAKTRQQYPGSPELEFFKMTGGRGLPPIVSMEVLDADLPPPETSEGAADRHIEAMARSIAKAIVSDRGETPASSAQVLEAMARRLDALEAENKRLAAELAAKGTEKAADVADPKDAKSAKGKPDKGGLLGG